MSKMTEGLTAEICILIYFTYEPSLTHSSVTHTRRRSVSRESASCKHAFVSTGYTCTVNMMRVLDKDALASA